jgi:DNA-binding response OmpR family regulator
MPKNNSLATILLVEDEELYAKTYKFALEKAGFEIIYALNGEEGLQKMKKDKPDLVLLDLIMPVKDGFEVLEEVSQDEELKKIPIIVLTNLGQASDMSTIVSKVVGLGVKNYLVKTDHSMEETIEKIKSVLAEAALENNGNSK